jgi:hypothetical protein
MTSFGCEPRESNKQQTAILQKRTARVDGWAKDWAWPIHGLRWRFVTVTNTQPRC